MLRRRRASPRRPDAGASRAHQDVARAPRATLRVSPRVRAEGAKKGRATAGCGARQTDKFDEAPLCFARAPLSRSLSAGARAPPAAGEPSLPGHWLPTAAGPAASRVTPASARGFAGPPLSRVRPRSLLSVSLPASLSLPRPPAAAIGRSFSSRRSRATRPSARAPMCREPRTTSRAAGSALPRCRCACAGCSARAERVRPSGRAAHGPCAEVPGSPSGREERQDRQE